MGTKKLSIYSVFLFISLAELMGCSSSSNDSVMMSVNIGIPVNSPTPVNLSQSLVRLMNVTIGKDCYQDQIYLFVRDHNTGANLTSQKVKLRTILDTNSSIIYDNSPNGIQSAVDYINTKTYLDAPLSISVPNSTQVEIGLVGSFFDPNDAPISGGPTVADGSCDQLGAAGLLAIHSSNIFGHKLIDANALKLGSIMLNINVIHANPDGNYNGIGAAPDIATISSKNDWIGIDSSFLNVTNNLARLKKVSYLNASASVDGLIKINVDPTDAVPNRYYVPSIFPMTLEFKYTGSTTGGCTNGNSCSGYYRAIIQTPGASITANLIPTTGSNYAPPSISGTFNTTDYSTNNIGDVFNKIGRADIIAWETQNHLSNSFSQLQTAIPAGQIILFKTTNGNYGKMKVVSYTAQTPPTGDTMNVQFLVFNNVGVPGTMTTSSIPSTYVFSFDQNSTSCTTLSCDIWWENLPPLKLIPKNTAKLGFYP